MYTHRACAHRCMVHDSCEQCKHIGHAPARMHATTQWRMLKKGDSWHTHASCRLCDIRFCIIGGVVAGSVKVGASHQAVLKRGRCSRPCVKVRRFQAVNRPITKRSVNVRHAVLYLLARKLTRCISHISTDSQTWDGAAVEGVAVDGVAVEGVSKPRVVQRCARWYFRLVDVL